MNDIYVISKEKNKITVLNELLYLSKLSISDENINKVFGLDLIELKSNHFDSLNKERHGYEVHDIEKLIFLLKLMVNENKSKPKNSEEYNGNFNEFIFLLEGIIASAKEFNEYQLYGCDFKKILCPVNINLNNFYTNNEIIFTLSSVQYYAGLRYLVKNKLIGKHHHKIIHDFYLENYKLYMDNPMLISFGINLFELESGEKILNYVRYDHYLNRYGRIEGKMELEELFMERLIWKKNTGNLERIKGGLMGKILLEMPFKNEDEVKINNLHEWFYDITGLNLKDLNIHLIYFKEIPHSNKYLSNDEFFKKNNMDMDLKIKILNVDCINHIITYQKVY